MVMILPPPAIAAVDVTSAMTHTNLPSIVLFLFHAFARLVGGPVLVAPVDPPHRRPHAAVAAGAIVAVRLRCAPPALAGAGTGLGGLLIGSTRLAGIHVSRLS